MGLTELFAEVRQRAAQHRDYVKPGSAQIAVTTLTGLGTMKTAEGEAVRKILAALAAPEGQVSLTESDVGALTPLSLVALSRLLETALGGAELLGDQRSVQLGDIAKALLAFGETVDRCKLIPALSEDASRLVYDDPFAFALAACLDRGIPAEIAWTFPLWIKERLGHLDPKRIAEMSVEGILETLDSLPRKPRYRHDAPHTVLGLSRIVASECAGDAALLWRRKTSEEVERAFKRIRGVGRGIASMVVLLLEKVYGVRFGDTDHRAMNVKPDVHVIRVLSRLGVLDSKSHAVERSDACDPRDATGLEGQAIAVTRRMHPEYPALLDTPLWMIGRMWCHAQAPACPACPVLGVCPRHGVPAE